METEHSAAIPRRPLLVRSVSMLVAIAVILGLVLFVPAGTIRYWQAWVYLAILLGSMTTIMIYLLAKDPDLLDRRLKQKEREEPQKRLRKLFTPILLAIWIIPGFDVRWGWSSVPRWAVLLADLAFLIAYLLFFWVLRSNSYAARTVEVEQGQRVISTGPYAFVRHPMYTATLIIYLSTPPALGSFWALLAAVPLPYFLALRIRNEEEVLVRDLPGYEDYQRKTRHRLVPFVW